MDGQDTVRIPEQTTLTMKSEECIPVIDHSRTSAEYNSRDQYKEQSGIVFPPVLGHDIVDEEPSGLR
jgi:hypothetical protein